MRVNRTFGLAGAAAATVIAAAMLWPAAAPVRAQAGNGACTCDDEFDVRAKLELTEQQLEAWKKVLDEIETDSLMAATSGEGANERYCGILHLPADCTKRRAGGVDPKTRKPVVNPVYAAAHCDIVVDSVDYHERMHPKFVDMNMLNPRFVWGILRWTTQAGARVQAWNEMFAHEEQILFLQEKLLQLQHACPQEQRYPSDADEAAQKQRVAAAARRVTTYANSIS